MRGDEESTHVRLRTAPCTFRGCLYEVRVPPTWDGKTELYCVHHEFLKGRDPQHVVPAALDAALKDLMEPSDDLVTWSLPELHDMLGYLLPGTVTYGCAFPKGGKTTFLSNQIAHWDREGFRVWVMPTESRPKGLVTRIACFRAGVAPDDAMSRRLRARADAGDREAEATLLRLMHEIVRMNDDAVESGSNIAIEPAPRLTRRIFRESCQAAASAGYSLVVVDHVDHIGGDPATGEAGYAASEAVQYDALEFAERFNMPVLLMSQFNTRVAQDPLAMFRRPVTDWLWMKGIKDQVATTMFGLYRPMREDVTDALLQSVRQGRGEPWRIAKPDTMGVAEMLSRYGGGKIGRTLALRYDEGVLRSPELVDDLADQAARAGVHTGGASSAPRYDGRLARGR